MADQPLDFLTEFKAVLIHLETKMRYDPDAVRWLGMLSGDLIANGGWQSWGALKQAMPPEAHRQLIEQLEKQGLELKALGRDKPAYATHVLRLSLLAAPQKGAVMRQGERVFDRFIDTAARLYRANRQADAAAAVK